MIFPLKLKNQTVKIGFLAFFIGQQANWPVYLNKSGPKFKIVGKLEDLTLMDPCSFFITKLDPHQNEPDLQARQA